jgi:peptidoglycan/LPS O-acetylase OafA/YrhL
VLLFSGAVALLIASLVQRTGLLRISLETPVLVYIGKRSYGIYLIHMLAANSVAKILPPYIASNWVEVVGVTFAVSIAGASLLHVAIEQPCISMGRRLSKRFAESAHMSLVAAEG